MQDTSDISLTGAAGTGWAERTLRAQRRKLFAAFLRFRQGGAGESVLAPSLSSAPAGLQEWSDAPSGSLFTPCNLDASAPPCLPYPDDAYDWVYCAEVIERLASPVSQQALVAECYRVARKGVFITTPNRRHPLEFNSGLPFLHWLPAPWRSRVPGAAGMPPSLVDAQHLYAMAARLPGTPAHDVGHKRVLGIKAHFFLMIHKRN